MNPFQVWGKPGVVGSLGFSSDSLLNVRAMIASASTVGIAKVNLNQSSYFISLKSVFSFSISS